MSFEVAVNNILEMKLYARCQGQTSITVRHYRCTALAGTGRLDTDCVSALDGKFATPFKECLCTDAQYLGTSLQIIKSIRRGLVYTTVSTGDGQYAGEPLPKQTAGLITLRTEEATRAGRGRMYIPFPAEGANHSDAKPTGAYLDALHNFALLVDDTVVVVSGANSVTLVPVIYHRATLGTTNITEAVERTYWGTQRRRSDVAGGDRLPF